MRTFEKNAWLMCLCNLVLQVSLYFITIYVKQRSLRFEKAVSGERKIYIMKKAIMLHSRVSRRFANNEQ